MIRTGATGASTVRELVGREGEAARLRAALQDTLRGSGRLYLVVGEPGIGKSTTVEQFAPVAQAQGFQVYLGRCAGSALGDVFAPWTQILEAYVRRHDEATLRAEIGIGMIDLVQLVPELGSRLSQVRRTQSADSEFARYRLFDAITAGLKTAAYRQPVLLILDDLHWADPASVKLVEFLARRIESAPLLVVATYAPVGSGETEEILDNLHRERLCERVHMTGFTEPETRAFLAQLVGADAPESVVRALARETHGNPLFLQEVVRLLFEEKILAVEGDRCTGSLTEQRLPIPEGLRSVIGHRYARLSTLCQRVLMHAAVVGLKFSLPVLERTTRSDPQTLLKVLEEAARAGVIQSAAEEPGRWRFTHALVPETLYRQIDTARRVRLHRAVGEALEQLHAGDIESRLSELAHHFVQAVSDDEVAKAVDYSMRAAHRASALHAHEDSVRHYRHALEVLERQRPREEDRCFELLLALADAFWKSGQAGRAREAFGEAAASARERGNPDQLGRVALGLGRVLQWSQIAGSQTLVDLLEEALRALPEGDSELRLRVLARLGWALYHAPGGWDAPSRQRRIALSDLALEGARRVRDLPTLVWVLYNRHYALWEPASLSERLIVTDELIRLAEQSVQQEMAAEGLSFRIAQQLEVGNLAALDAALAAYGTLAAHLRQPWYLYMAPVFQATRATLQGRFEEAERLAQLALGRGSPLDEPLALEIYGAQLLGQWLAQGRAEDVEAALRETLPRYPEEPIYRALLASAHSDLGRTADAQVELDRLAAADFRDIRPDNTWFGTMSALAHVAASCRDLKRAALLYELLRPFAAHGVVVSSAVTYLGSLSRSLGLLAATLGHWDFAVRHFEHAMTHLAAMEARPWLAHTQHDYARALAARGHPEDLKKAAALLAETRAAATELDLPGLLRSIERM